MAVSMNQPRSPLVHLAIAHSDKLQDLTKGLPFVFLHLDNCCRPVLQILDPRGDWYLTIDWIGIRARVPGRDPWEVPGVNTPATRCFHRR